MKTFFSLLDVNTKSEDGIVLSNSLFLLFFLLVIDVSLGVVALVVSIS